jgi:hypothetical protein
MEADRGQLELHQLPEQHLVHWRRLLRRHAWEARSCDSCLAMLATVLGCDGFIGSSADVSPGAPVTAGWWTNEPMVHVPYNASQAAMPVRGLKNGGLWLFDLSVDRTRAHRSNSEHALR